MNILLLNPNTTQALTDRMARVASAAASAGTRIEPVTATRGVPYISTRAEAQIAGAIALEILAERRAAVDGVIMAAFGDPGLGAAREMLEIPVVGMAEAAMLTACMLGRRFAIVTFARALEPWFQECVEANGLAHRCAGVQCATGAFSSIDAVQAEMEERLVETALACLDALRPDVIILAGAPLSGLAPVIRDRVPVPLVDGVVAAVKQIEGLVAQKPRKAQAGSFRKPAGKMSQGLAPALAQWLRDDRPA
ncbi:aspartate/glutamate racemase family protein [Alsobacter sp. KACC 23698]|uniref:Aspartate/glutamate racemase family protein n=1 Tax=Alsobacter sp. KACC 23698 TaxID=3149229 RepID=A0AAU7JEJ4_9HYPH